eukprot:2532786-Amphidinium_carterae.1
MQRRFRLFVRAACGKSNDSNLHGVTTLLPTGPQFQFDVEVSKSMAVAMEQPAILGRIFLLGLSGAMGQLLFTPYPIDLYCNLVLLLFVEFESEQHNAMISIDQHRPSVRSHLSVSTHMVSCFHCLVDAGESRLGALASK